MILGLSRDAPQFGGNTRALAEGVQDKGAGCVEGQESPWSWSGPETKDKAPEQKSPADPGGERAAG